ncbi:MAG: S8 family serine peptidase [Actinobacteria bacterium]|nr:S8 family serine peptidase [Actinomycetota bacterium]
MVTAISKRFRRGWTLVIVASISGFVLATSASAHRSEFRPGKWPSHTVLIGYSSEQALETALRGRGARVVARVPALRTVSVRPSGDAASFAADLSRAQGIDFVQPPVPRRALVEPALTPAAVPGGSYQWQYVLTGADRVPDRILRAASGIRIGIVDSGADLSAPDLEGKRPMTYNAVDNSSDVTDTIGHGTFVASLAAGLSSNGEGMAGIAGEARLITIKASSAGMFTDFELAAAIAYAVDNGAKIVNLSLGGPRASRTEVRALEYALTKDVLLVAAAGNGALEGNPVSYPAALLQPLNSNGVSGYGLSVGASTITGARADFSNHGSYISLAAPGEEVFGAISKDSSPKNFPRVALPGSTKGLYGYSSGTSFSAPQVAGAAALVWAANSSLSSRQVADILKQTASGGGQWNPELGFGVINVAAAVEVAAVTPAVSLQAVKYGDAARLSWRGSTRKEKAYRILSLGANDEEKVLVPSTTERSQTFQGDKGVTYSFVVESLDAAGGVIARSAPVLVTLGQAKSALTLTPFKYKQRGKRYSIVFAVLAAEAPDVKLSRRIIRLEQLLNGKWRFVSYQWTDASGRVIWVVPRGRYTIRAIFKQSSELRPANSRALTVSGF